MKNNSSKLSGDLVHLQVFSPSKRQQMLDKSRSNFSNGHTLDASPNATAVRDDTANLNDDELLNHLILHDATKEGEE